MSEILIPPTFLLDWQAAEIAAVEHMKVLGFIDAQATGSGTDGGIDALSTDAAAQVKFYANPVGRPDIQRLRGAAHEYRLSLFYSTGGYTKEAVAYSNDAGVALFVMDPYGQCVPMSDLATVLIEPAYVQERKERLEELQATRYRYAASALQSDLALYEQFARKVTMGAAEAAFYGYVAAGLSRTVAEFAAAIEGKRFVDAAISFGKIQMQNSFLSSSSGSVLVHSYAGIEEAISAGWLREVAPTSDHLLQSIALGIINLREFLLTALSGWTSIPEIRTNELIDEETSRFTGMLLTVSLDETLLSDELLTQLKSFIKAGVERTKLLTTKAFQHIQRRHGELGVELPRGIPAQRVRAESEISILLLQLKASVR
jgi:hypothetical protein